MKKRYVIAAIVGLIILSIVGVGYNIKKTKSQIQAGEDLDRTQRTREQPYILEEKYKVEEQYKIEKEILDEYAKEENTLVDPYIVQNPYKLAPLTALAIFETESPYKIHVTVRGKGNGSDVSYEIPGYTTYHEVPLLWLYPGITNQVELKAVAEDGKFQIKNIEIDTQILPERLLQKDIQAMTKTKELSEGLILLIDDARTVVDEEGEVRWYIDTEAELAGIEEMLDNGHLLIPLDDNKEGTTFIEVDWLGKIYWMHRSEEKLQNDAIELPNGNILAIGKDHLLEINRKTGRTKEVIAFKDIFRDKVSGEIRTKDSEDWVHPNALVYKNGSIILSSRNQHGIVKFDYKSGKIQWRIGNDVPYHQKYMMNYLQPIGTNFEWFYSQHQPTLLPDLDNDLNTTDILLFDNGVHRTREERDALQPEDMYSRIVHYRINEKMMTIEQVWDIGKDLGLPYYAEVYSGAQYLSEKGHYLGVFNAGGTPQAATWTDFFQDEEHKYTSKITEFGKNKEILHQITIEGPLYRAYKIKVQKLIRGFVPLGRHKGYMTNSR